VSDTGDGVVHVTGGKWTTYRQMAEDAVDALSPYVARLPRTRTKSLALYGVGVWRPTNDLEEHLYYRFGADAPRVVALIDGDPSLGEPAIEGLPYLRAEFLFSAREEMAVTLVDLLARRTRAHLLDARTTLAAAPTIAALVAASMGWSERDVVDQVAAYRGLVETEFAAAGLVL
jgi:glycerol-3-phosphate dehydrogenase